MDVSPASGSPSPTPVGRRAVLSLGAAVLLSGCASTHSGASAGPHPSDGKPGASAPNPSTSGPSDPNASPTSAASDTPGPTGGPISTPTAGNCPTSPQVTHKPGTEQYLPCSARHIALTIDDGPDPTWTPQVLALLARLDIRATFCMIGENAARHRDLVARVADQGHEIANHTYTHPLNLPRLPRARVDEEIHRTMQALTTADGGHAPTLFRAPGGAWTPTILASCAAAGLRPLDWSVDTRDWSRPGVAHIVEVIVTQTHPGSIILDHDGGGNRHQTVTALGIALPRLIDSGYQFVMP